MMDLNKTKQSAQIERISDMQAWLQDTLQLPDIEWVHLAGDASFRRYYRVFNGEESCVVMDAPPLLETSEPFIKIAKEFKSLGLRVPEIYAANLSQGFVLLSDLGDRLLLNELNENTVDHLYHHALEDLLVLQTCQGIADYDLPRFDHALYNREFTLFTEWYLGKLLNIELTKDKQAALEKCFNLLIEEAVSQPQVMVHRDYHSRNLLLLDDDRIGIIDFQDAVWGPITYDLLSLLRDCYIDWPQQKIEKWVYDYYQRAIQAGILQPVDFTQFMRWFDWIGLQRHLKCLGIFARLDLLYGKAGYLKDIPRVLMYAQKVSRHYPEFESLAALLAKCDRSFV